MANKVYTIGRAKDNHFVYNHSSMSSKHAVLEKKSSGWFITDTSSNGTTVNGKVIPKNFKVPISAKDKIVFAGAETFHWNNVNVKTPLQINTKSILIGASALLVIISIIFFIKNFSFTKIKEGFIDRKMTFTEINKKYEKAIVLIYHSFLYKIILPNNDILYVSHNGNDFEAADRPDALSPIEITGTGFFVGEEGKIVTNRHVAFPWSSKDAIRKTINNALKREGIANPKIEGKTYLIGIAINLQKFDGESSIVACDVVKKANIKELDIAVIQTKNHQVPDSASFIPIDLIDKQDNIAKASEACIIGFPSGLAVAYTGNIIEATFNTGVISQISDIYKIQYDISSGPGASGSPVFNKKGKVIAVNFSGLPLFPGNIVYGIKSKYVHNLLR